MRVRIIFSLKNKGASVPFHHQYMLAQLIKAIVLKGGDPAYNKYYSYNFSGLKGQTKISRSGLHFYSKFVTLVFSCPEKAFIDYFLENLFELPKVEVGSLILVPHEIESESMPEFQESMKYICISPLVLLEASLLDDSSKTFIPPETDDFSDKLYENTIRRMEDYGYSRDSLSTFNRFQLLPDKDYLRRLKEQKKKFARIYPVYDQDVKYEVRGYTFPFTLFAIREVHKFIFDSGLGIYTHKGFGMVDVVRDDADRETKPYEMT